MNHDHGMSAQTKQPFMRLFVESHEIAIALCSAPLLLICSFIDNQLVLYTSWLLLAIIHRNIHPAAIGFSAAPKTFSIYTSMLRGFVVGYCFGYIALEGDFSRSLFSPGLMLTLMIGEIVWRGYFQEFMNRRGFSQWIGLICTAILSTTFYVILFDRVELSVLLIFALFMIAIFAGMVRNSTRNVWDALIVQMAYYILFLNVDSIAIYLYSLIN